ncbi:MAG: hypothetical protein DRP72_02900 [Candidatus Omnitrophota bacterium]|nr:MAG: hypothetical protein DRP72_02900 [Candidatus Omnitrophota bacterium]
MEEKVAQNQEQTQVKEEKKTSEVVKTVFKYILGIVLVGLGIWAVIGLWQSVWTVIKGCLGVFLILAGAITIAIAKE